MTIKDIVQLIAGLSIPLAIAGLFLERTLSGKGLGVRSIQTLAVATLGPVILILALEETLDGSAVAALIGSLIGYLFAQIADFDRRPKP